MDQRHHHSVGAFIRGLAKALVHVSEMDSSAMLMTLSCSWGQREGWGGG